MKKTLILFLCACLLLCICPTVSAEGVTITAADQTVARGEKLIVPVSITANSGFWMAGFDAYFDPAVFEYQGYTVGDFKNVRINEECFDGKVYFLFEYLQNENLADDGTLFNMEFVVKGDAKAGDYAIPVSAKRVGICDYNAARLAPIEKSATVTVNCDGHKFIITNFGEICTCGAVREGQSVSEPPKPSTPAVPQTFTDENSGITSLPQDSTPDINQPVNPPVKKVNDKAVIIMCIVSALAIAATIAWWFIMRKKNK